MPYTTITTEGGLIPADILDAIAREEIIGQRPEDFGLERSRNLSDRISAAWQAARGQWALFQSYLADLGPRETATTETREHWVIPLLRALGYRPSRNRAAYVVEGRTYAISHRIDESDDAPPLHIESICNSLDARPPSGRPRLSPHALVQEYLNATEQLWGIVTNGERLRLLRDSARFTRPAYVEFDLRAMFEGEKFSEFAILYRLLHRSRLPDSSPQRHRGTEERTEDARLGAAIVRPEDCLLERYHQLALESGGRVREGLRDGVEGALKLLGNGLLAHPANTELRAKLVAGRLSPLDYYRQLLRLVYRLLFLMVAEERGLIAPEGTHHRGTEAQRPEGTHHRGTEAQRPEEEDIETLRLRASVVNEEEDIETLRLRASVVNADKALKIYYDHYSIGRLRRLAETSGAGRGPFDDLWLGLLTTFRLFEGSDEEAPRRLGLAPLGGDLFGEAACADLTINTRLRNADLLAAIRKLSLYRDQESKGLRRVNYGALDVEELGSVYESLLDYRPVIAPQRHRGTEEGRASVGAPQRHRDTEDETLCLSVSVVHFDLVPGTERKTTGSYYTRPELVQELIKSALAPVIEERLGAPQRRRDTEIQQASESLRLRASVTQQQEAALLSIRVCDPACGSGHFLLAAARRIGRELAKVRAGEDQPSPGEFRRAVRDVIRQCIYGVDLNPLAVDLCKLALWIEGHCAGMPLSFLDHHIKRGNSLIGATHALVAAGIPDDAYKPVTGDDRATASSIKKRNKQERDLALKQGMVQRDMFADGRSAALDLAEELRALDENDDDSVAAVRARAARYAALRRRAHAERATFDLWTAAFFQPLTPANARYVPTTRDLIDFDPTGEKALMAAPIAEEVGFFHWELEFPQVFHHRDTRLHHRDTRLHHRDTEAQRPNNPEESLCLRASVVNPSGADHRDTEAQKAANSVHHRDTEAQRPNNPEESLCLRASVVNPSGFDVVLGNPPWERIKLQEQEHFVDVPEIARAANKAARERLINEWRTNGTPAQRARIASFDAAKHRAEAESRFVRASGRFPLTAVGDVNTYALFAEHARALLAPTGRAGIIVPTGIATDDSTRAFFGDVVAKRQLVSLYDFENREKIFADVDSRYKFSLLTLGATNEPTRFLFFATNTGQLAEPTSASSVEPQRVFTLTPEEIGLINPNTRTAPVFRTARDAGLTKQIYRRVPVLVDERAPQGHRGAEVGNPWGVSFLRMFDMSNDSHLFQRAPGAGLLPLYEAKLLHQFTHRWATYGGAPQRHRGSEDDERSARDLTPDELADPGYSITPRYWVPAAEVEARLAGRWERGWLLGWRDIARATDERTFIAAIFPRYGSGDTFLLMFPEASTLHIACLLATLNNLVFDFVARQKIAGTHAKFFTVKQLPVLPPSAFSAADIASIVPRVLELVYTAWDITAFAEDVWAEADESLRALIVERRMVNHRDTEAQSSQEITTLCLCASVVNSNPPPPFIWHDERRARIRAELDARIARLYGLTRDELRYILDPADVYGPDFPGETFRVLKEKEMKRYGEYRTRRLVLEAWDREEAGR